MFISYRRTEKEIAGRLRDRLANEFGDENVFYDVVSMQPRVGIDFREEIRRTLGDVDVVVVVIGPTLGFDPASTAPDYLRMELETALASGKRIVPVLVRGADMPAATALPPGLEGLAYRHAARLRDDPDFHSDADVLIRSLGDRRRWPALAAAVLGGAALIALLAIGIIRLTRDSDPPPSRLVGGQVLKAGDRLQSTDGRHTLEMTSDGRLVASTEDVVWWSQPVAAGPDAVASMQDSDGNLVVYGDSGPIWDSGTFGHPGAYLTIESDQADGRLTIHDVDGTVLWQEPTASSQTPPDITDTATTEPAPTASTDPVVPPETEPETSASLEPPPLDPSGPDLTISTVDGCEVIANGALSGADVLNMYVALRNLGPGDVSGLVPISGESDTGLTLDMHAAVGTGSASTALQVDLSLGDYDRRHEFTITVDPRNETVESDESNNVISITVDLADRPTTFVEVPCT